MRSLRFFAGVLILLVFSIALCAQSVSTAQIRGTVQDASSGAVPGAEVRVTQTDTGASRAAITSADGGYVLTELPIGPYRLEVTKDGFTKYIQTGIVLQVASNPTIDVDLRVGSVTEQVQVEANATMVETQSTGVGQVIDSQRVIDLPLVGRNVTDLISLSGGATQGSDAQLNTSRNYPTASFSVAGGLASGTAYVLDGALHNDSYNNLNLPLPFPDALQEFKIETSALPAQYGMHSAAAVNAVTKSGTNAFHGSAFEFVRNYKFNARNFFAPVRDSLKRNQFGGTVGGPIKKNKIFFFAGYQGTTNRQTGVQNTTFIPTSDMLKGDFRAFADASCNGGKPLTLKAPFVNNVLPDPSTQLNPAALNIAARLPTTANPCGKIDFGAPSVSDDRQAVGRIDYQLSDKHTVFGRYLAANLVAPNPYTLSPNLLVTGAGVAGNSFGQDILVQATTLGSTYLINSTTVNSFRATINRSSVARVGADFFSGPDVGINMFSYFPKFLNVAVTNGFSFGNGTSGNSRYATTTGQIGEDIGIVHGSHQMAFGVMAAKWVSFLRAGVAAMGSFTFSGQTTGAGLADFLTGTAATFAQAPPNTLDMTQNYIGLYAQDTWKVTSRLTVNYGLRWEPYFAQQMKDGHSYHFDMNDFINGVHSTVYKNAPNGLSYPGDPGFPGKAGMYNQYKQFLPRVGLSWDPRGDGKTSVRASYGIFYDILPAEYDNNTALANPWGSRLGGNNVNLSNPWATLPGGNPYPLPPFNPNSAFNPFGNFISFDYNFHPTYVQQWNLSIQRQVGKDWLVSATYLGNELTHLPVNAEYNPAVFRGTSACTIAGTTFANCGTTASNNLRRVTVSINPALTQGQALADIIRVNDGGTGSYHGMLLSAQRRLSRGITFSGNYTWSHCIADFVNNSQPGPGGAYTDITNRRANRGNCNTSGTDRRHLMNMTLVATTPKFSGRMLRMAASGWRISSIVTAQTGPYLSVTTGGQDIALNGINGQRANALSTDVYGDGSNTRYLNQAAFGMPTLGTLGNLGAANILGPGFLAVNMGLSRIFRITEGQNLELRAEASNILNRLNQGNPNLGVGTSTFGQVTATAAGAGTGFVSPGDPRIMQFALKYIF